MAFLWVHLETDRATGALRFQDREHFGPGTVPIGLSTPLWLPCRIHGGYEAIDTVSIADANISRAAWTLLVLGQVLLAAANRRCDAFLRELNSLRVAFCEGLLSIPLAEVGARMHEALIDAVGVVMSFEQAVRALAEALIPPVIADATARGRRALPLREVRRNSDLVVGADGTPSPPGVPAWQLPHRGRAIWSWCDLHGRWHCQLKASFPSARAEAAYRDLAAMAIWRRSGSCDEYRVRKNIYVCAQRAVGPSLPERPELTMLWYRQWACALNAALQPVQELTTATLEATAGAR